MVSTPAKPQATRSHPALPIFRAISAGTIKMPDPIMAPTTNMVESKRPNPCVNSRCSAAGRPTGDKLGGWLNGLRLWDPITLTIAYCIHKIPPMPIFGEISSAPGPDSPRSS